MKKIIIEIGCFLSMPFISNPFHPIETSPGLGGVGCKAVPVGRSVQPCSRCRQVGSLWTGGKGRASGKELQLARLRYRLGPRDFFFGVIKRRGLSCCF